MRELKINPELKDLLPPLTNEEYKRLEKNIIENGFDRNFPIMEWHGFIADGHNRYSICKKHNIEPVIGTLAYDTKEEVMEWMLDIQLGRRNLSPIKRIAVAEKYRPIYERQAKANQAKAGGDKKSEEYKKSVQSNLTEAKNNHTENETNTKLANIAGVKPTLYKMGAKVLNSDNEELKQRVLSEETSISAGYKELIQNKNKKSENEKLTTWLDGLESGKKEKTNEELKNVKPTTITPTKQTKPVTQTKPTTPVTTAAPTTSKSQISDEVKQICADLKTEKTKEYLDSIWDYRIDFIECMKADADMFFDTLRSYFDALNNLVTEKELNECIAVAKQVVETINQMIKQAEISTKTKIGG